MKTFQTFDISAEYDAIHRTFPCHKDAPVIGLTGNFQEGACTLLEGYFTSILKAGGIPFIIPPVDETNSLINSLNALDGLLLTGGADINPLFLGEEPIKELHSINPRRDRQELLLAKTGRRPADTDSGNMPRHTGDERRFWRQPVSGYPRTDGRGTDQTRSGFGTGICLAYGPDRERFLTL